MKEEDQIKILSYLDEEASEKEESEVETMLSSDPEARDFLNAMKIQKNRLESTFNAPEILAAEERLERKLSEHNTEESALPFFPLITNKVSSLLTLNNAAVAALSICLTVVALPYLSQSSITLDDSISFQQKIDVNKFRDATMPSLNSPDIDLEMLVLDFIRSTKVRGEFNSDVGLKISMEIEDAYTRKGKSYYYGQIYDNQGNIKRFYAVSGETNEILFSD
tara:strand:- start:3202 stop:3867 length:666 start_codon:yes stop_codon:yes gene_type:complete